VVNREFRPGAVLVACGGAGLLVFGLSWIPFGDVMKHLPWVFVVAPAVGLICAHFLTQMLVHRVRARKTVAGALLGAIGAMGLFALFLPSSLGEARALIVGRTSITSAWVGWLEHRLDRDKDGATGFFAGGDCAPDNPAIGPAQMEIVGNGIDDDCAAGDLEIDPADYIMGKNHHKIPEGITKNPHVIFITTDALSFRHTSLAGYHRDTTPHLKEWAKRATVFENAFSTSASTRLSFPGMLTGMLNSMVKMKPRRIHPYPYHESVPTLGTLFKKKGYRTVHLMGDSYFGKKKWGGYWKGFDVVDEGPYKNAKDKGHTAAELTRAALTHIESEDDRPLFLWLHYYDHHEPYKNPKGARSFGSREVDRYDSELHHTDKFWGLLLAEVESRWSPDEFVVVFTADHGEAFDANHPTEHHDFSLHTEVLHVPLIIQSPWGRGQRIEGLSSHLDILPTLADLSGIGTNPMWIGESLVPCLAKKQEPEKTVVYSMFYIPEDAKNHRDGFRRFGVRTKDFYYFVNYKRNTHRLVKWQEDRLDRNNLYRDLPDEAALYRYLAADKLAWLRVHERGLNPPRRTKKKGKAKAGTVVGAPGK
jgi:arylsulfatase A-like enzyme